MTHTSVHKRRNTVILIVIGILLAAAVVTTAVVLSTNKQPPVVTPPVDDIIPDPPVVATMQLPVKDAAAGLGYSADKLVYFETLKLWQTHTAVDFKAEKGTDVLAVLDGTVKTVASDSLNGTYVVLEHDGGKISTYKSLEADVPVSVGDTVKQGDAIGTVGDTMLTEINQGAHLHFELAVDGKAVNPADYIESLGGK